MNDAAPQRLRRPSWKDPRLLLGILLVLASTAGTVWLVGSLDQSVEVYVARDGLPVGQRLDAGRLDRVKVRLGDLESGYIPADEELSEGAVAVRFVGKGQLLPRQSVGDAASLDRKPVPITVDGVLPEQLTTGEHADLWVSSPDDRNGFKEPRLVVRAAEVAQVVAPQQTFAMSSGRVVILLVPDALMPQVLAAQGNKARITVVWNPTGTGS
ncbi:MULTISPECIES: hypothetical protein [Arthrobacter]|uniref:SAF domain-containing protein n=2 Tax=Arthrobacter TaxID=1663 RepID=A0ABU9KJP1_9MICC|nr:hypothetical protein [Arthrobacter sp. YJM1]MDP5227224.1 hypothetical protein [Arthrobacter sp. YJM1]